MNEKVRVMIPCRMASTRLPNKPLADIGGKPMIIHVAEKATAARVGQVTVACDSQQIFDVVKKYGYDAVMTDPALPSGSDRIWQGVQRLMQAGEERPDIIINVQGDEPLLPPELVRACLPPFWHDWVDVVTFAHPIHAEAEKMNPSMVKAVTDEKHRALYFSRSPIPYGGEVLKRHIGIYAYRYGALERFVLAEPSPLERQEKLEQLRGLELGLNYYVGMTDAAPIGVDTPEDLERVRKMVIAAS
ncbi:MAG: 3-deoxy-manno-octulosonate cytidylyltransferase [Proteobacteria bacterium]|nr:3-deoxy-manno-octulosonate cytidylyltransferase [Pseudomonadota bacterium]